MNLQNKLEQFRSDNPFDVGTQAKRLLATDDKELILYTLELGLATAKQRQHHYERDYIKNVGRAPQRERFVPGPVTGAVKIVPIPPTRRQQNAFNQLMVDVWLIGGEQKLGDASHKDLTAAIKREGASSDGHQKNMKFYAALQEKLSPKGADKVREKWDEKSLRSKIEQIYGEFRKGEAGEAA